MTETPLVLPSLRSRAGQRFEAIHELELEPDALEAEASLPGAHARTGKLVTSAALVLMFAFFVLSISPGTDIKQFGIGLAAGITSMRR